MNEISEPVRRVIKRTARKLKGHQKREFIAEVTLELLDGNARKAEREFGWGRETVRKGIRELTTSIRCIDNYSARGNKRTEERLPGLAEDIRKILKVDGQPHARFRPYFTKGRLMPGAVRNVLIDEFAYKDEELPNINTISNILARLGYPTGKPSKSEDGDGDCTADEKA